MRKHGAVFFGPIFAVVESDGDVVSVKTCGSAVGYIVVSAAAAFVERAKRDKVLVWRSVIRIFPLSNEVVGAFYGEK